jgi:hypothetical protein
MKKISSQSTIVNKYLYPLILLGLVTFIIIKAITIDDPQHPREGAFFFVICFSTICFFIYKDTIYPLADEVYDCGDHLLAKRRGVEVKIHLSDIKNVSYSREQMPTITLSLRKETALGRHLLFAPQFSGLTKALSHLRLHPVAEDLIDRIESKRAAS